MTTAAKHFVATGYVVDNGKTLLLLHKKLGLWLAPGGHIDEGELPDQAVLREVLEETGLEVEIVSPKRTPDPREAGVKYLHLPNHVQLEDIPNHPQHIDLIYFCRVLGGQLKFNAQESNDLRWHSLAELDGAHIRDEVRQTAAEAILYVGRESTARQP